MKTGSTPVAGAASLVLERPYHAALAALAAGLGSAAIEPGLVVAWPRPRSPRRRC